MARLNEFLTRIDISVLHGYIMAHGRQVAYGKGERMAQQGEPCRYMGVVTSGYFKYVAIDSEGNEVVTGFSFAGDIVTDYAHSFLYGQPSPTSIVAGCGAGVRRVTMAAMRRHVLEHAPEFVADTSSKLLQEAYRRYIDLQVKSPSERYRELVARNPDVMHTVLLHEIASFLGVSRRQLHRIRAAEGETE